MFSTYDLNSFSQLITVKTDTPGRGVSKQPRSMRSKTGCVACRQRKKKCDETHPVCLFCQKKNLKCEWGYKHFTVNQNGCKSRKIVEIQNQNDVVLDFDLEDQSDKQIGQPSDTVNQIASISSNQIDDKNQLIQKTQKIQKIQLDDKNQKNQLDHNVQNSHPHSQIVENNHDSGELITKNDSNKQIIGNNFELVTLNGMNDETPIINLPNLSKLNLASFEDFLNHDFTEILDFPISSTPSSTFNLYLDETGLKYLHYFENKVAHLLSISPHSSNYFLKTFFTISITNECLLNALAAWGALFHEDGDIHTVNEYLNRAKSLVQVPQQKYDYLITLAYYMIALGIQICSGDVRNWYFYFNKCGELLQQYGGVFKFLKDFDYSNDAKFLVANFQIHDIMSSSTLSKGTICSMNSYNDIFKINKLLELDNYGIDPYQGCIQPIFLILGEIMNVNVELRQEWKEIFDQLDNMVDVSYQRLKIFKKVDEKYQELLNKINFCKPIDSQLKLLTPDAVYHHLKLFELHKLTCKIYILLYIKQTQPISSEIQYLLLTSFDLLEQLSESSLVSSLNMPLLICGICSCYKFDRMKLDSIMNRVYSRYKVGNVKKIWDVIKESWRRNPKGKTCVDWIDICNDFGWKLSVC